MESNLNPDPQRNTPSSSNPGFVNKFRELSEHDPKFNEFLEAYQKGEWDKCRAALDDLVSRHPDVALLRNFDRDLEIQLSLREISQKHLVENKKLAVRQGVRVSVFSIALVFFLLVVITGAFILIRNSRLLQIQEQNRNQVALLSAQAQQLLASGQPGPAATVIEKIAAIDPAYNNLDQLRAEVTRLNDLESSYQVALEMINSGDYPAAIKILTDIENAQPGLWDVPRQLSQVNDRIKIKDFFDKAQAAYEKQDWVGVITNYEAALNIDPKLDDGLMKEQLLNGYLHAIIDMLESNTISIVDIEKAETYYRKAVSMIPQSRTYSSERQNLEEVSSSLLILKYSQTARQLLEDPNQTVTTVAKAVTYFSKASNMAPDDAQLRDELTNAQLYQIGFQYFVDMNWGPAIDNLKRLVDIKRDYAGGNASLLLYEAYAARGRQYYSVGLYVDARSNFEQAEIVAWDFTSNPFMLFDVQVWLGNTIGRLRDYANAISYYQYAVNTINIYPHLKANTDFAELFYAAEGLVSQGDQLGAYEKYSEAMTHLQDVYEMPKVEIADGGCLVFFAAENHSTVYAVQKANNLLKSVTVTFGQELIAPTITK